MKQVVCMANADLIVNNNYYYLTCLEDKLASLVQTTRDRSNLAANFNNHLQLVGKYTCGCRGLLKSLKACVTEAIQHQLI